MAAHSFNINFLEECVTVPEKKNKRSPCPKVFKFPSSHVSRFVSPLIPQVSWCFGLYVSSSLNIRTLSMFPVLRSLGPHNALIQNPTPRNPLEHAPNNSTSNNAVCLKHRLYNYVWPHFSLFNCFRLNGLIKKKIT